MKILILRFSSIGDIVLTTPVVRALAQQVPGAVVHFATKPGYRGLLDANPYISKVHCLIGSLGALVQEAVCAAVRRIFPCPVKRKISFNRFPLAVQRRATGASRGILFLSFACLLLA